MSEYKFKERLGRIETRMMCGFNKLGVDPTEAEQVDGYTPVLTEGHLTSYHLKRRLTRLETRIVSGFMELGVDPRRKFTNVGLSFDTNTNVMYIDRPSTTTADLLLYVKELGLEPADITMRFTGDYLKGNCDD